MLRDLLSRPGVTEHVEMGGRLGVMALHAGSEPGTGWMAVEVARVTGASLYVLRSDRRLPSTSFDPGQSGALERFLRHVTAALSLHGLGRPEWRDSVLLGGRNARLRRRVGEALRRGTRLGVVDDPQRIPRQLRGLHRRNPVNLPPRAGVQLELCPRARRLPEAGAVLAALAEVVRGEMESR